MKKNFSIPARENPFPFPVRSISELPEGFQSVIHPWIGPEEPIHSILILPPQPFLKRGGVPRQALLSTECGILHVRDGNPPVATYLPAEDLLYVRQSLILLYGGLELVGETNHGRVQILAEFNTVGQNFVDAVLRQFLGLSYRDLHSMGSLTDQTGYLLERLGDESFKFMNGLRLYALQPGERLLDYIYQPRISRPFLKFMRRPVAPASLFALTDKALVLIEEDKARAGSYGWVITLCPRNVIRGIESQAMQEWSSLRVLLQRSSIREERRLILDPEVAMECMAVWTGQNKEESIIQLPN